jgi:hypothetical protein
MHGTKEKRLGRIPQRKTLTVKTVSVFFAGTLCLRGAFERWKFAGLKRRFLCREKQSRRSPGHPLRLLPLPLA